ncbi:MAG: SBBP repeat-containing protein [Acidobacteria bacterium]|nr:SBBP repeat-containing protein [Acidobacteriota bacterium]
MFYRKTAPILPASAQLKKRLQICLTLLSLLHGALLPAFAGATTRSGVAKFDSASSLQSSTHRVFPHPVSELQTKAQLTQGQPYFEENLGQAETNIQFLTRSKTGSVGLTKTGLIWQSHSPAKSLQPVSAFLQMNLVGGNPKALSEGANPLIGKVNYLLGNQAQWRMNIPTFAEVRYHDVYPGVNLVYYFHQSKLEYDFVVSAGTDVKRIKLAFAGSRRLTIDERGDLVIYSQGGELRQHRPFAYQIINGEKRVVEVQFAQLGKREVGFQVASAYNPNEALIIDPSLSFSTYLGGSDSDTGAGIAVDSAGNIYVAGNVNSTDFPVSATAFQPALKSGDIFVTKLNPAGNAILYSTFLGGTSLETATGIALDANGNAVVTGTTASSDFPTTAGAYQRTLSNGDAFVAKLNATGSGLTFSTLLGGSGNEISYGVAVDTGSNVYVTGSTTSTNFPTTTGVFQDSNRGGTLESFVTKLNPTGTQFVYSSYLGGGGSESGTDIAVDATGNAYVTGYTTSANFPTTAGVVQSTYNGATNLADAFVAKVNAGGSALLYSTYLGGKSDDVANAIAIDTTGNAYIVGNTASTSSTNDFPTTASAFQKTFSGSSIPGPRTDAFITKLNAMGTALSYSTYLGGNGADNALGVAVNAQGAVFVAGSTSSSNFPTSSDGFKIYAGAVDGFVAQLDATGASVPYGSYLGGASNDSGVSITIDSVGNIYTVGTTRSPNFPVLPNVLQSAAKGGQEVFITAIKSGTNIIASNVTAASYGHIPMARESIVSVFGVRLATRIETGTDTDPNTGGAQLPTTLAGTTVKIKDSEGVERLAPLFFASPEQINYQIPPNTPVGGALVTVTAEDGTVSIGTIQIVDVAPDLFSADSSGKGAAVGHLVRVKAGNIQTEEQFVKQVNGTWELIPIDLGADLGANTDQVFLVLFGTGIRFRPDPPQVSAKIGGADARVDYARNQCCFVGVDQVNLLIPRSLIGKGEVDVVLTVEGKTANTLRIAIK